MPAPVRVACLGAGWVTVNRHIPALIRHGGFEIVGIVDRDERRAQAAATPLGVRHHAASRVSDVPFCDEVDAVICGTAPAGHHPVVKDALAAGKHVLCEKPLAMSVAEGEEVVELATARGRTLAIVHNFQFARSVRKLAGWIAKGRLGPLRSVWAVQLSNPRRRLPEWFDELPFGLFYDESPHLIYMARAIAGGDLSPISVTVHPSTTNRVSTPAQIDAQMRCGEVPVSFHMQFEAPLSEWHVSALGDSGIASVDLFRDIATFVPNDGRHHAADVLRSSLASTGSHWRGYLRSGASHLRGGLLYGNEEVFARFHDAVRGLGQPAGIDADDALSVLRVQHWMLEAGRRSLPAEPDPTL